MLWDAWQRQHLPSVPLTGAPSVSSSSSVASDVPSAPVPEAKSAVAVPVAQEAVTGNFPVATIQTDLFTAEISALGGDLTHLALNRHNAAENKSRPLILFEKAHHYAAQSGLIGALPNHKTVWQIQPGENILKEGQNTLRVMLTALADNEVSVTKTYIFQRGSYSIAVEHEVVNAGSNSVTGHAYYQLVRDNAAPDGANSMMSTFTGPAFFTEAAKFQKVEFADILEGKAKHATKAVDGWVAMIQLYFVSAWLPTLPGDREFFTRKIVDNRVAAGVVLPFPTVAPGASVKFSVPLYAGPQEQAALENIAPGFGLVVDYGWLTVIASPLYWVLEFIHRLMGNWGWAIIGLTVLIKLAFFPLSAASYKSMAKMRVLTPKLMKLKETYGDDKQRMNQEMMELYKREKVNPLGGCLPILIQIPVFIALYWVLLGSVEMRQAPWLGWITDLSSKDPYYVLPLLMGATMFVQTKLNPAPPDPMQAKLMLWMPVIFTGMFLFFPSGLVLYWTVNNVLSIAQQWQVNRMIERAGLPRH